MYFTDIVIKTFNTNQHQDHINWEQRQVTQKTSWRTLGSISTALSSSCSLCASLRNIIFFPTLLVPQNVLISCAILQNAYTARLFYYTQQELQGANCAKLREFICWKVKMSERNKRLSLSCQNVLLRITNTIQCHISYFVPFWRVETW